MTSQWSALSSTNCILQPLKYGHLVHFLILLSIYVLLQASQLKWWLPSNHWLPLLLHIRPSVGTRRLWHRSSFLSLTAQCLIMRYDYACTEELRVCVCVCWMWCTACSFQQIWNWSGTVNSGRQLVTAAIVGEFKLHRVLIARYKGNRSHWYKVSSSSAPLCIYRTLYNRRSKIELSTKVIDSYGKISVWASGA